MANMSIRSMLVLGICIQACAPATGPSDPSIYGGESAAGLFPDTAALYVTSNGTSTLTCSGIAIAPRWVLTAAHCVADIANHEIHVAQGDDVTAQTDRVPVVQISIHPEYRKHPLGQIDIALIQTASDLHTTDIAVAHPRALPAAVTTAVRLVGFGRREDGAVGAKFSVQVTPTTPEPLWEWQHANTGRDSCQGDSGGPALSQAGDLIGIISRGNGASCGRGGMFSLVAPVACWIGETIDDDLWQSQCRQPTPEYTDDQLAAAELNALCAEPANAAQATTIKALHQSLNTTTCDELSHLARTTTTLDLAAANISDLLPVAKFPALLSLDLRGNPITSISSLRDLPALHSLAIDGARITEPHLPTQEAQGLIIWGKERQANDFANTPFLTGCLDRSNSVTEAEDRTIRALKWKAQTDDCHLANERLLYTRSLNLEERQLSDVSMLSGFSSLETLNLAGNPIVNIAGLAALENLKALDLSQTHVVSFAPLAKLIHERGLQVTP